MHIWNTDIHVVINSLENSLRTSKILHTDHSVLFTHATNRETDTFSLNESTVELSSEKCILYIAKCKLYLRRTIFYKTSLSYLEHRLLTTSCDEMLSFILCFSDFFWQKITWNLQLTLPTFQPYFIAYKSGFWMKTKYLSFSGIIFFIKDADGLL